MYLEIGLGDLVGLRQLAGVLTHLPSLWQRHCLQETPLLVQSCRCKSVVTP